MNTNFLLVAAIDFGSTYSGYAVSTRDEPMKVLTCDAWIGNTLASLKTPTSLLLTPSGEFDSFGFEAEESYTEKIEDGVHRDWYFFSKFKMLLHKNKTLSMDTTLEDATEKTMPALTVFSTSIAFLKGHLLDNLRLRINTSIREEDILFVLTVPAIWDDRAKQFMRQAAVEAGIKEEHLKIVLEPEAASLWCQNLPIEMLHDSKGSSFGICTPETKYMVIDLGGGTADITAHEKQIDGSLKELYAANGGPWGGTCVDTNFKTFLSEIVGKDVFQLFTKTETEDMMDLMRDFEVSKRKIGPGMKKFTIKIPSSLAQLYEESSGSEMTIQAAVASSPYNVKVRVIGDKLRIDHSVAKSWFQAPLEALIKHLRNLMESAALKSVKNLLLVGGFSECKVVQEAIISEFSEKRVVIPPDSGMVVLKGAVLFGHQPKAVMTRVARATYGTEVSEIFDENVHPMYMKETFGDKSIVRGVFAKYIELGQELPMGFYVQKPLWPVNVYQNRITFNLYASKYKNPKYISDVGCRRVGQLDVEFPDGDTTEEKRADCMLMFGDAELQMKVTQVKTGKTFSRHFPFK